MTAGSYRLAQERPFTDAAAGPSRRRLATEMARMLSCGARDAGPASSGPRRVETVMSSRLASRAAVSSSVRSSRRIRRSATWASSEVIRWWRRSISSGAPSPESCHVRSPSSSDSRRSRCCTQAARPAARRWAPWRSDSRDALVATSEASGDAEAGGRVGDAVRCRRGGPRPKRRRARPGGCSPSGRPKVDGTRRIPGMPRVTAR